MRRDRENVNGRSYNLPLHVAYGSNEGDVTCSYDPDRGLASIPPYDATRGSGVGSAARTVTRRRRFVRTTSTSAAAIEW